MATGQGRTSLDGSQRVRIKAALPGRQLWRVRVNGCPMDGFNSPTIVMREWPILLATTTGPVDLGPGGAGVAAVALARERDLLGAGVSFSEHARRKASRRRGRPGA